MWSPKPKGKVIRRPKPSLLKLRCRAEAAAAALAEEEPPQEKSDPHRDSRYFGFKHSDITRIFFVDSTNSVRRDFPSGPFQKKPTDITAHLDNAIPSHASPPLRGQKAQASPDQPVSVQDSPGPPMGVQGSPSQTIRSTGQIMRSPGQTMRSPGQTMRSPGLASRVQSRRTEHGDAKAGTVGRVSGHRRDQTAAGGGATAGGHQNENIRPTTAPTGEMRRLSAANAGHTPGPSTLRSGTGGSRRTPGSAQTVSRPGTQDSGLVGSSVQSSSSRGSLQCSSRLMTGNTSCGAFGSRLQSVPE